MFGAGTSARAGIWESIRRGFVVARFSDWLVLGDLVLELLCKDL